MLPNTAAAPVAATLALQHFRQCAELALSFVTGKPVLPRLVRDLEGEDGLLAALRHSRKLLDDSPPRICRRREFGSTEDRPLHAEAVRVVGPVGKAGDILRIVWRRWIEPPIAPTVATAYTGSAYWTGPIAGSADHSEDANVVKSPFAKRREITSQTLAIALISPQRPEHRRPSREERSPIVDKRVAVASDDAATCVVRLTGWRSERPEHDDRKNGRTPTHSVDLDMMRFDIQDSERG